MARITVEDCLEKIPNRFELVMVTAHRAKNLLKKSAQPLIDDYRENKEVVTALREIAEGDVIMSIREEQHVETYGDINAEESAGRLDEMNFDEQEIQEM